jgi:hypothetical protein
VRRDYKVGTPPRLLCKVLGLRAPIKYNKSYKFSIGEERVLVLN